MSARKPDYYAVLGVTSNASNSAIRAAYKKLALQWHPDRHLVGKEHAAQIFVEVNQAYHALMDGRESTHSSSTETSSTTSAPTSSPDTTRSDTHTKSTSQASSRPPSANSNASKRSGPKSSTPHSSPPSDAHSSNMSDAGSKPRPPPAKSSSSNESASRHTKAEPRSRPAMPHSTDGRRASSDRMRNGRKSSKSHDHLRDSPDPAAQKSRPPPSTRSRDSEGRDGSVHSRSSKNGTSSPSPSIEIKNDSRAGTNFQTRSGALHSSKPVIPPTSGRLHKSSKFGLADEFVQKLSKGTAKGKKEQPNDLPRDEDVPSCGSPLRAINTPRGTSKEWLFPLPLTLDEMYHGTSNRFLVTRELLSRRTEQVEITVNIAPGTRSGTRIVCPRTGHQRKDGTLQDVVFLVEEVPDERFSRVKDDLYMDVCVPWADSLAEQGGELCIEGMDREEIIFTLPYPIYDKATEGQVLVKGAGMPIQEGRKTVGRGDMIVRWRVMFSNHPSKWQTFKKALHLEA
ncbi:DnaJ-domain-containing protein [Paxillus ammoniavirescens]|nr:DnaJ-domain-containing protein [Paxillus ammoniavirescens]